MRKLPIWIMEQSRKQKMLEKVPAHETSCPKSGLNEWQLPE
jgi:hypothetical protein